MMGMGNQGMPGPATHFHQIPPQNQHMHQFNGHQGGQHGHGGQALANGGWQAQNQADHHDYYLAGHGSAPTHHQNGHQMMPGSLGYSQTVPHTPHSPSLQAGGLNPLQRGMRTGTGGPPFSHHDQFPGQPAPFGNGMYGPGAGPQNYSGFNNLGGSGVMPGAPGPRGPVNGQPGYGHGGVPPTNLQFKTIQPQTPMYYGHPHDPIHAIGDPNDPLSHFRANPARVDLVHESRGKVGYSPKPKREEVHTSHAKQQQGYGEKLIQSQLTFELDPTARKAPPKPILKKTGPIKSGKRPKNAIFNQDVLVHEVESWKIYNVDMAKEAKKNFRRESQSECRLV